MTSDRERERAFTNWHESKGWSSLVTIRETFNAGYSLATQRERERAAKVAESYYGMGKYIAAAIRHGEEE